MKSLIAVVALVGCEGGSRPPADMIELEDEGTFCLLGFEPADSQRLTFPADAPIELEISYDDICLSGSCTADRTASCSAILSDFRVSISTHASWIDVTDSPGTLACTDDCQRPTASCTTPPLPAGDYAFTLRGNSLDFSLPTIEAFTPCLR